MVRIKALSALGRITVLCTTVLVMTAACTPQSSTDIDTRGLPSSQNKIKIRLSIDDDAIIPNLAIGLGYFADEGIDIQEVDITEVADPEYTFQQALISGTLDFSWHWFQHTVFGARNGLLTVLVANRIKDDIKSGADFESRRVAEGARYATKAMLVNYLVKKHGGDGENYTSVAQGVSGRREAVVEGIKTGEIDLAAFMEPMTSTLMETGLVSPLFDLTTREATMKIFGAGLPSETLLASPQYIGHNPDVVQRMVNALVKTMRYVNNHSAEEIVSNLPGEYMDGKDATALTELITKTLKVHAQHDYTLKHEDVELTMDVIHSFPFDDSGSGQWRAASKIPMHEIDPHSLYDNRFVEIAMKSN